jgi:hypothetical protein
MTSSDDEFRNNDFFLDINDLFGNLNMGDNTDANDAAVNAAAAHAAPYVTLLSLCHAYLARVFSSTV